MFSIRTGYLVKIGARKDRLLALNTARMTALCGKSVELSQLRLVLKRTFLCEILTRRYYKLKCSRWYEILEFFIPPASLETQ